MTFFFTALLSAVVAAFSILLLLKLPLARLFLDTTEKPHALHATPTPRLGGVAIVLSVVLIVSFQLWRTSDSSLGLILLPALVIAVFSMIDDRRGLPVSWRLAAHFAVALFAVLVLKTQAATLSPSLISILGGVLLVVAVVWMTNLYNFMDGANGLAGLMGCIGFGGLALVGANGSAADAPEVHGLVVLCSALSGACAGFLTFNFPAGRVFLGDAGSIALGFFAGTTALYGVALGVWPLWVPVLCFSPFIVDASVTLLQRMYRREKFWLPHREHFYQRLIIDCDWSHRRTAIVYAAIMLLAAGDALRWNLTITRQDSAYSWLPPPSMLLAWVLIYGALLVAAESKIRRQHRTKTTNMSTKQDQGAR